MFQGCLLQAEIKRKAIINSKLTLGSGKHFIFLHGSYRTINLFNLLFKLKNRQYSRYNKDRFYIYIEIFCLFLKRVPLLLLQQCDLPSKINIAFNVRKFMKVEIDNAKSLFQREMKRRRVIDGENDENQRKCNERSGLIVQ